MNHQQKNPVGKRDGGTFGGETKSLMIPDEMSGPADN